MKDKDKKEGINCRNDENIIRNKENNEKAIPSHDDIKLISVNFIRDNEKFVEEFIQLKKLAKLEKEKISLPSITPKINIEKNSYFKDSNKDFDLEKKFQLRGLVHEKEEFLSNSFNQLYNRKIERIPLIKRNNTSNDSEYNFNRFTKRNFNKRNTFNGKTRSKTWKFSNQ